jgi:hypothetical protein
MRNSKTVKSGSGVLGYEPARLVCGIQGIFRLWRAPAQALGK